MRNPRGVGSRRTPDAATAEDQDVATPIDLEAWPRAEHFEHYRHAVPCSYAMTVELDVTAFVAALRDSPRTTYIAQIWAIASIVDRHDEFKLGLTEQDAPAVWSRIHPAFTVFNPRRETFACVWTRYHPDFATFHDEAAPLLEEHRHATAFFPQGPPPANTFDVSSVPWASFTGFTLDIAGAHGHLAPIFTLGRYVERDGKVALPLAVQVHHAAADGFHTARLVNELQVLLADPGWV
jgi:chloramphenicol O-acetyltransferase type A